MDLEQGVSRPSTLENWTRTAARLDANRHTSRSRKASCGSRRRENLRRRLRRGLVRMGSGPSREGRRATRRKAGRAGSAAKEGAERARRSRVALKAEVDTVSGARGFQVSAGVGQLELRADPGIAARPLARYEAGGPSGEAALKPRHTGAYVFKQRPVRGGWGPPSLRPSLLGLARATHDGGERSPSSDAPRLVAVQSGHGVAHRPLRGLQNPGGRVVGSAPGRDRRADLPNAVSAPRGSRRSVVRVRPSGPPVAFGFRPGRSSVGSEQR